MSDQEPEVIENAEGDAQVCPSTQSPPAPQPEAETAEEYDPTHPEPDATSPKAENHSRDNDAFSILHPEVKAQLDALIAENLVCEKTVLSPCLLCVISYKSLLCAVRYKCNR